MLNNSAILAMPYRHHLFYVLINKKVRLFRNIDSTWLNLEKRLQAVPPLSPTSTFDEKAHETGEKKACLSMRTRRPPLGYPIFKDSSLRQRLVHTVRELEINHPLMQAQARGGIGAPWTKKNAFSVFFLILRSLFGTE